MTQYVGSIPSIIYQLDYVFELSREVTANLVERFMEAGPQARRRNMIDTLTSFLSEVGRAGEASKEFINLYKKVRGALQILGTRPNSFC